MLLRANITCAKILMSMSVTMLFQCRSLNTEIIQSQISFPTGHLYIYRRKLKCTSDLDFWFYFIIEYMSAWVNCASIGNYLSFRLKQYLCLWLGPMAENKLLCTCSLRSPPVKRYGELFSLFFGRFDITFSVDLPSTFDFQHGQTTSYTKQLSGFLSGEKHSTPRASPRK